jgi:hypothetical protein
MLRTIAISLVLMLSIGIMLPFANSAHGIKQSAQVGQRKHYRKYSRSWWRRHRARLRRQRAAALARRNALLSLPKNVAVNEAPGATGPVPVLSADDVPVTAVPPAPATVAAHAVAPEPVIARSVAKPASAKLPGQMNLAVVAMSRPNPAFLTPREENKMLAGVSVSDLRRIVIDKMITNGGWVTNDFVREVNGARVFVVTAKTPKDANSPEKTWTFYFTEAGGRIYGLTTDTPVEHTDRMATEAERFINNLRAKAQAGSR